MFRFSAAERTRAQIERQHNGISAITAGGRLSQCERLKKTASSHRQAAVAAARAYHSERFQVVVQFTRPAAAHTVQIKCHFEPAEKGALTERTPDVVDVYNVEQVFHKQFALVGRASFGNVVHCLAGGRNAHFPAVIGHTADHFAVLAVKPKQGRKSACLLPRLAPYEPVVGREQVYLLQFPDAAEIEVVDKARSGFVAEPPQKVLVYVFSVGGELYGTRNAVFGVPLHNFHEPPEHVGLDPCVLIYQIKIIGAFVHGQPYGAVVRAPETLVAAVADNAGSRERVLHKIGRAVCGIIIDDDELGRVVGGENRADALIQPAHPVVGDENDEQFRFHGYKCIKKLPKPFGFGSFEYVFEYKS